MANDNFKQMDAAERVNSVRNEQGCRLMDEVLSFGRVLPDARGANSTADKCLPGLDLDWSFVEVADGSVDHTRERRPVESIKPREYGLQRPPTTAELSGRSTEPIQQTTESQRPHAEVVSPARPNRPVDRPNDSPSDRQRSNSEPMPGAGNLSVWEYIHRPIFGPTTREPQRIETQ